MTVNYFVLSGKRIDQNLSVCLAGLRRLHLLLFRLPPLLVLDVPQPLLLHKALLHLVMLEVFLSQLCELSGGREGVSSQTESNSVLLDVLPVRLDQHPQVLSRETKVLN